MVNLDGKKLNKLQIGFLFIILFKSGVQSSELMNSADLMEAGNFQVSIYGQSVNDKPVMNVSGAGSVTVPVSGGGSAVVSSSGKTEIEMDSSYNGAVAALTFRPNDGLHYRVKFGQIRDFELDYDSGTATNSFKNSKDGYLYGFSGRWNITQPTIVSMGIALDLGYTRLISNLDSFQAGSSIVASNHRYEVDEYQGALNFSRRWKKLEPYGGLKIQRKSYTLKDLSNKGEIEGSVNRFAPFIGVGFTLFDKEILFIEGSFVDEESISVGLNLSF